MSLTLYSYLIQLSKDAKNTGVKRLSKLLNYIPIIKHSVPNVNQLKGKLLLSCFYTHRTIQNGFYLNPTCLWLKKIILSFRIAWCMVFVYPLPSWGTLCCTLYTSCILYLVEGHCVVLYIQVVSSTWLRDTVLYFIYKLYPLPGWGTLCCTLYTSCILYLAEGHCVVLYIQVVSST